MLDISMLVAWFCSHSSGLSCPRQVLAAVVDNAHCQVRCHQLLLYGDDRAVKVGCDSITEHWCANVECCTSV